MVAISLREALRDRSPDAAWIAVNRWNTLNDKQKKGFPPICPDFVIELRSHPPAFSIPPNRGEKGGLQDKMQEYIASGLKLGWLIDPQNNQVEIYRKNKDTEILQLPNQLSGENVLPGFTLDLGQF